MTTNEGRCEPPPGTAAWTHHWIGPANGLSEPWLWSDAGGWFRGAQFHTAEGMAARDWVYSAPCPPPAVVAALVEALEAAEILAHSSGVIRGRTPEDADFYTVEIEHLRDLNAAIDAARAALAAYREGGR